jgi:hypothetical protein
LTAGGSGLVWDICIWLGAGGEERRGEERKVLKYLETRLYINCV